MTVLDAERIRQSGFGQNAMFEVWVAQERANAPLGRARHHHQGI